MTVLSVQCTAMFWKIGFTQLVSVPCHFPVVLFFCHVVVTEDGLSCHHAHPDFLYVR